jgi:hypothetical protein
MVVAFILDLCLRPIEPVKENKRSTPPDEAGIDKYLLANFDNPGKFLFWLPQ